MFANEYKLTYLGEAVFFEQDFFLIYVIKLASKY